MTRITQLYSAFGSHFKIAFMQKYKMVNYSNDKQPVFMFGCYGNQIEVAFANKSKVKVCWAGSDAYAFIHNPQYVQRMKERPDIEIIAISKFIKADMDSVGLPCKLIPIVPHDNSDIQPHPLGDAVYAYRSAYNPKLFRRLQEELPHIEFIDARHTTYTRPELMEVYKRCFMGVRLTLHDGCANTVAELGYMGRKCIWNGGSPSSIPFDLANFNEIKDNVLREYENRATADWKKVAAETRSYMDVGEGFLEY
jgi:hypothetical protein